MNVQTTRGVYDHSIDNLSYIINAFYPNSSDIHSKYRLCLYFFQGYFIWSMYVTFQESSKLLLQWRRRVSKDLEKNPGTVWRLFGLKSRVCCAKSIKSKKKWNYWDYNIYLKYYNALIFLFCLWIARRKKGK